MEEDIDQTVPMHIMGNETEFSDIQNFVLKKIQMNTQLYFKRKLNKMIVY